jgi:Flp pilus assembly protein TadG
MSSRTRPLMFRPAGGAHQRGQTLVIFAILVVVMIAMAGLLIDGGMAWGNRRQAQGAADTAALAAANAIAAGNNGANAAAKIAKANGFDTDLVDCNGTTQVGQGVIVHTPTTGPHTGNSNYVEVITTKAMPTTFSRVVGQNCWLVSARAVAVITAGSVATCNFCSLNNTKNNHTLLLQNGSKLRVDGDIYVNSWNGCGSSTPQNGLLGCGTSSTCTVKDWNVCGDGFDVFGTPDIPPAYISARTISVVGGWETHDQNKVTADSNNPPPTYDTPCTQYPNPLQQTQTSNVCIHMPPLVDPYAATPTPTQASLGLTSPPSMTVCPTASGTTGVKLPTGTSSTQALLTISSGSWTICPGMYYGGLKVTGTGTKVVMQSGVYFIVDNANATGFSVTSGATVDGSAGVMIYNSGTKGQINISQLANGLDIQPDPDLDQDPAYPGSPGAPQPTVTLTNGTSHGTGNKTYAFHVNKNGTASLTGEVHWFDGSTELSSPGDPNCPVTIKALSGNFTANCQVTWTAADVGTHGLVAVFYSKADSPCVPATPCPSYDNIQVIQSPREIITSSGVPGGTTLLTALKSGTYKGYVIWQDKANLLTMYLSPQSPLAACTGSWMTDGIPTTAPAPCGGLGGISGTIYAPGTTSSTGPQVQITASGLADLQIVANKILITSGTDARFAFTPSKFASSSGGLVE